VTRLLFVGGCERSGTSLVQKLLCLDPRIAGSGEFVYTGRLAALHARMAGAHQEPWASRLRNHFSPAELDAAFRRLLLDLLRPAREAGAEVLWVAEKTPSNVTSFGALAALFPDAAFLHVVRDGRDVLTSHLEVARRMASRADLAPYARRNLSPRYVAARWNEAVAAHRAALRQEELRERYLMIRYEDLVTEPGTEIERMGRFLGLEIDRRALHPERVPSSELSLPIDGIWTTEDADQRGFAPERNGRWRHQLSTRQRLRAHLTMGDGLAALGYAVDPLSARISSLLHRLQGPLRRRRSASR